MSFYKYNIQRIILESDGVTKNTVILHLIETDDNSIVTNLINHKKGESLLNRIYLYIDNPDEINNWITMKENNVQLIVNMTI